MSPVIVLAAGRGVRAHGPKGLIVVRGQPWLEWQLRALEGVGLTHAMVVLGAESDRHLAACASLARPSGKPSITHVINPRVDDGPFSSLMCGLERVDGGAFVLPVDVPVPPPAVWRTLVKPGALATIPTFRDRGGHPVYLSPELASELRAIPREEWGIQRLDVRLRALGARALRIPVEHEGILANWNEPSHFEMGSG